MPPAAHVIPPGPSPSANRSRGRWARRSTAGRIAAALVLVVFLGAVQAGTPSPARAADPVPACTTADDLTAIRAEDRVADTLVDTRWKVGKGYVPSDLVSSSRAGFPAGFRVRAVVVPDLAAMRKAAKKAGVRLVLNSAYRSYAGQAAMLTTYTRLLGRKAALLRVARPGHSEHQLGVAVDMAGTAGAHAWLAREAWRYGFVISYPAGRSRKTCYQYEPWHLRWVGRDRAAAVRAAGVPYRVWLWRNVRESFGLVTGSGSSGLLRLRLSDRRAL